MKIGIVTQSVRTNRVALDVAKWVKEVATKNNSEGFTYEIIDLLDYDMPFMNVLAHEAKGLSPVAAKWLDKIEEMDGFVFVTAEYNHGLTGVFKNALDFITNQFENKPVSLVGYGGVGGARAIEQLRLIMAQLQAATTQKNVNLMLAVDFEHYSVFKPKDYQDALLVEVLEQIELWTKAFKTIR